jgi:ABC-type transport system substrate-binding protein
MPGRDDFQAFKAERAGRPERSPGDGGVVVWLATEAPAHTPPARLNVAGGLDGLTVTPAVGGRPTPEPASSSCASSISARSGLPSPGFAGRVIVRGCKAFFGGLAILAGLAAAGPAAAENVLRWASVGGALTADPHAYDDLQTFAQLRQVYETLVGLDSNLELVPQLATAWRLVEPTVWEFELRPNVRFHDGTPFTADDVVFSFGRAKTELPWSVAARIESVAAVRAIGEHTVRIETKFPDPQLWEKVRGISIMSAPWAEAHDAHVPVNVSTGEENYTSRHANGTGPFVLKEFEANGRVVMVRSPDWWGIERYPITSIGSSTRRSPTPRSG